MHAVPLNLQLCEGGEAPVSAALSGPSGPKRMVPPFIQGVSTALLAGSDKRAKTCAGTAQGKPLGPG